MWADPRCSITLSAPSLTAICTAVAPQAVLTLRTNEFHHPPYRPLSVPALTPQITNEKTALKPRPSKVSQVRPDHGSNLPERPKPTTPEPSLDLLKKEQEQLTSSIAPSSVNWTATPPTPLWWAAPHPGARPPWRTAHGCMRQRRSSEETLNHQVFFERILVNSAVDEDRLIIPPPALRSRSEGGTERALVGLDWREDDRFAEWRRRRSAAPSRGEGARGSVGRLGISGGGTVRLDAYDAPQHHLHHRPPATAVTGSWPPSTSSWSAATAGSAAKSGDGRNTSQTADCDAPNKNARPRVDGRSNAIQILIRPLPLLLQAKGSYAGLWWTGRTQTDDRRGVNALLYN